MRGLALVEALALGHTTCRAHSRTTSWKDVDRPVSFSSSAYSFKLKDGVGGEVRQLDWHGPTHDSEGACDLGYLS